MEETVRYLANSNNTTNPKVILMIRKLKELSNDYGFSDAVKNQYSDLMNKGDIPTDKNLDQKVNRKVNHRGRKGGKERNYLL